MSQDLALASELMTIILFIAWTIEVRTRWRNRQRKDK
jgi:uncharacterized membrane protein